MQLISQLLTVRSNNKPRTILKRVRISSEKNSDWTKGPTWELLLFRPQFSRFFEIQIFTMKKCISYHVNDSSVSINGIKHD